MVIIIMSCGTDVISIYIFIQFMENISVSLDESAIVDGASYWTIYWKIILPLLKPAIVTACILKGRCNLQRVLRCKPLPHKPGDQDNGYLTLQVRRTYGQPVQPDMCRCYHIDHTGTYSIHLLSETDLQWYYTGCCKGLIIY